MNIIQQPVKLYNYNHQIIAKNIINIMEEFIQELKEFKTRSMTIFMVVQAVMGLALALGLELF